MTHAPKLLLVIPHLGGGGAEMVTALLANGLSREKYQLHLALITQAAPPDDAFAPQVAVHGLRASRVRAAAIPLLRLVWRLKPNLILSGMAHLNFLVLLLRPFFPHGTSILVRQNSTLSASLDSGALPSYTRILYRLLYRHADKVICQTRAMAEDLARGLNFPQDRLTVLPNPVKLDEIRSTASLSSSRWCGPGPHLLAVGRLSWEKGFDLLLEALAQVRTRVPSADLAIVGGGPQERLLKALSTRLGLEPAVHFLGHLDSPYLYFPGATLFVLSSRHEGLPNALLEAAAAGLPLVAMPCCGGVIELLRGQPGVWTVPEISADALAATLLEALASLRPEERFTNAFVEQFSAERAIAGYEQLIDATLEARRP
jgi:glycosyltransferase involved in cell wall biosynthesis